MTKNAAAIAADVAVDIPTNISHLVSAQDVRDRLIDITDAALFPYASMDAVATGYENADVIAVNRGDSDGAVLPAPVYLQYYDGGGTPKISVVELGHKRYAFQGRIIDLRLAGAVATSTSKTMDAFNVKARGHLDDYGGGAILVPEGLWPVDDIVDVGGGGDRAMIGLNDIAPALSRIIVNHNAAFAVIFGSDSNRAAAADVSTNRSNQVGASGLYLAQNLTLSAVKAAFRVRNSDWVSLRNIQTDGIPRFIEAGQDTALGDASGLDNDVLFLRLLDIRFNAVAGTYAASFGKFNSGAVLDADYIKLNGAKVATIPAFEFSGTHANWDKADLGSHIVSEDHATFCKVRNHGVSNLAIHDNLIADSVSEAFLDFQPANDTIRLHVGNVIASDDDQIGGSVSGHQSYGIIIAPSGGHTLALADIRGRYQGFGANAVNADAVEQININISARDCGVYQDDTYYSVVVGSAAKNIRAYVNAMHTLAFTQRHKGAIQCLSTDVFTLDYDSAGHSGAPIALAASLSDDDQVVIKWLGSTWIDMGGAPTMGASFSNPASNQGALVPGDIQFTYPVRIKQLQTSMLNRSGGTLTAKVQVWNGSAFADSAITQTLSADGVAITADADVVVAANRPVRVRYEGSSLTGTPSANSQIRIVRAGG